jgi:CRP-like cAMP-binding protein
MGRGSYFGLANAVGAASNAYAARAVGPTDLAIVDGNQLAAALDQNPRLWRRVSSLLAHRLKLIVDAVADNAMLPLPQRAVRCLLSHATSIELNEGAQPTVLMTQMDLARIIGIARSKLNRVLKGLEGQGLVRVGYGKITLRDLPELRRIAGRQVKPL